MNEKRRVQITKERLKNARLRKGLVMSDVAKYAGKSSKSTISKWESEEWESLPDVEDYIKLGVLYEEEVPYLMGLDVIDKEERQNLESKIEHLVETIETLKDDPEAKPLVDQLALMIDMYMKRR
jgi:transcriptional regulator with XRE-family HTH domain